MQQPSDTIEVPLFTKVSTFALHLANTLLPTCSKVQEKGVSTLIWKRLPIKVASTERQQQIATLVDAVQAFLQTIDEVNEQGRRIRVTVDTLLTEIEVLVEAIYREPADTNMLAIIDAKMAYGENKGLF